MTRLAPIGLALSAGLAAPLSQGRPAVELERREFTEWIRTSPVSPLRAVAVRAIGAGLSIGPTSADVPLRGVTASRLVQEGGRIRLTAGDQTRPVVRGKPVGLGQWQLLVTGPPGHASLTVFAASPPQDKQPEWFPYDSTLRLIVSLTPARTTNPVLLLAPDGTEIYATEAGTVAVRLSGKVHALRVFRIPGATEEESELEIYFRDVTSGKDTYPSGRFVSLIPTGPAGQDRYVMDLNRARNPFCSYNTVYPCPAPWRGNGLSVAVRGGEKYREK